MLLSEIPFFIILVVLLCVLIFIAVTKRKINKDFLSTKANLPDTYELKKAEVLWKDWVNILQLQMDLHRCSEIISVKLEKQRLIVDVVIGNNPIVLRYDIESIANDPDSYISDNLIDLKHYELECFELKNYIDDFAEKHFIELPTC